MALPVSVPAWQTIPDSESFYSFQKSTPCPQSSDLKAEHTITEDFVETHPSSLASVSPSELEEAGLSDFSILWIFQGLWGHWHRVAVLGTVWTGKVPEKPTHRPRPDLQSAHSPHLASLLQGEPPGCENTPQDMARSSPIHISGCPCFVSYWVMISSDQLLIVWNPVAFSLLIMWCVEAPVTTLPSLPYDQSLHIPHLLKKQTLNQHSYRLITLRQTPNIRVPQIINPWITFLNPELPNKDRFILDWCYDYFWGYLCNFENCVRKCFFTP